MNKGPLGPSGFQRIVYFLLNWAGRHQAVAFERDPLTGVFTLMVFDPLPLPRSINDRLSRHTLIERRFAGLGLLLFHQVRKAALFCGRQLDDLLKYVFDSDGWHICNSFLSEMANAAVAIY